MLCQNKHCNCKQYEKKYEYRLAKRKYPKIDNPLEKWECNEEFAKTCKDFKPCPARMIEEEFITKRNDIANRIPNEFKSAISLMAWDLGHSSGYEEVIGILEDIVSNFEKPIKDFEQRIRYETRNEERSEITKENLDIP